MRTALIAAALALVGSVALLSTTAVAQIYKWVDENGTVHYSDSPPTNTQTERVEIEPTRSADRAAGLETLQRLLDETADATARRRAAQQASSATEESEQRQRLLMNRSCLDARTQMAALEEQRAVYRDNQGQFHVLWGRDPYQGEREYLDDAERASEITRVRQVIATDCEHPNDPEAQEFARGVYVRSEYCAAMRGEFALLAEGGSEMSRGEREAARRNIETLCED